MVKSLKIAGLGISICADDTHDADVNIHKSMIRSQASKAVCWVLNHSSNMGKVTSVNNAAKKKVQRLSRSGGHGKSLKI